MDDPIVIALPRGVSRALALLILACSTACGGGGDDDPFDPGSDPETDPGIPPVTSGTWFRPPVATTWQWQLQGDVNIPRFSRHKSLTETEQENAEIPQP